MFFLSTEWRTGTSEIAPLSSWKVETAFRPARANSLSLWETTLARASCSRVCSRSLRSIHVRPDRRLFKRNGWKSSSATPLKTENFCKIPSDSPDGKSPRTSPGSRRPGPDEPEKEISSRPKEPFLWIDLILTPCFLFISSIVSAS